jgi:general secretion pathway protein J
MTTRSTPRVRGARRDTRGFTLIEVLLATVLLAAGLALAFATLRAATATAQRGEAIAQRNEHMRAVEQFLRRRLTAARPVGFQVDESTGLPLRFAGERDRMRFVADLPDYLGRGGPHLHDVRVVDDDGHQALEVGFSLVMAGQTLAEADPRPPERLATRLDDVRFRYRAMGADGRLGEWQDEWEQGDRLPLQVQVLWRDAGGREWPSLVVALPLAGGYSGEIGAQQ